MDETKQLDEKYAGEIIPFPVRKKIPSIQTDKLLRDVLGTRQQDTLRKVYIDDVNLVSFSDSLESYVGQRIDIIKSGLTGHLFINTNIFGEYKPFPRLERESDMENIAKAFFKYNGKNHVALVQYLLPRGSSKEHHHTLPEEIVQLAGRSLLELRSIEDDCRVERIELTPGMCYHIEPGKIHAVHTFEDEGSLTVPIKQTLHKKKDHLYLPKSENRLNKEFTQLLEEPHYNSGNEIYTVIEDFYSFLGPIEKQRFDSLLKDKVKLEKNPNIKQQLQQFLSTL